MITIHCCIHLIKRSPCCLDPGRILFLPFILLPVLLLPVAMGVVVMAAVAAASLQEDGRKEINAVLSRNVFGQKTWLHFTVP